MPAGADRLSVYSRVVALLRERRIPFAVVGAAALAVHGVSRATRDIDVLVTDPACLVESTWATLRRDGIAEVEAGLPALPEDSRRLWAHVVESR